MSDELESWGASREQLQRLLAAAEADRDRYRALVADARLLLKAWRGGGFPRESTQIFLENTND